MTFMIAIVRSSLACRYAPHWARSVLGRGAVHCAALLGGTLLESSGDLAISSRVRNGDLGLRAKYSRRDSSAIAGFTARFASSVLRLGITTGSMTIAPAAFNSAMFF